MICALYVLSRIMGSVVRSPMIAYGAVSAVVLAQEGAIPAGAPVSLPDDGQWPMPAKGFANTPYSGLSEITTENVRQLKAV